jgi:hypothetical protein
MDMGEIAIAEESHAEIDLEKGRVNKFPNPPSAPKPSPATTSSTAFSQNQSEVTSSRLHRDTQIRISFHNYHLLGKSKSYQSVKRFLSWVSSTPAENKEGSRDSENIIRSCKCSLDITRSAIF